MKSFAKWIVVSLGLFLSMPAWADPELVKKSVEAWVNGRYKIDAVTKTPMAGIYEVRVGVDLMYVDEKAQFLFIDGQMIDMKANKNLTQARIDELLRVNWKELPLDIALKQVNGTGKRKVVVFEDPNCPHCRTTRSALNQVKDATVYTFTYPILAADSEQKVKMALCAKDKLKAWNSLVMERVVPDNDGKCKTDLVKIIELGRKLGVTGTPTLVFTDGKRVPNGVSLEALNRLLDTHSKV
jgi:thiol:disulfide interchange protein DsbC